MPRLIKEEPMPYDLVRYTYVAVEGDDSGFPPGTEYEGIVSTAPPPTPEEQAAAAAHDAAAEALIEERAALRQQYGTRWMIGKDGRVFLGQVEP